MRGGNDANELRKWNSSLLDILVYVGKIIIHSCKVQVGHG